MAVTIIGGAGKKGSTNLRGYSFGGCTDTELVQLIADADAGKIDLVKDCGWQVGDRRTFNKEVTDNSTFNIAVWVLLNKGGVELVNGEECHFAVGLENCYTSSQMHSSNIGSWNNCNMRTWCNSTFKNDIASTYRNIFKQFKCITWDYGSNSLVTSNDYFALLAEKEVFGIYLNSRANEGQRLVPFSYFNNLQSRIKQTSQTTGTSSGSGTGWWLRSPNSSAYFCSVTANGHAVNNDATASRGVCPFGCI